jgi:hypothetical protein
MSILVSPLPTIRKGKPFSTAPETAIAPGVSDKSQFRRAGRPERRLAWWRLISRAAIEAVTDAANLSGAGDGDGGVQALRDDDVVAELRRIEGLSSGQARRLGREAVVHVGGHVQPRAARHRIRLSRRRDEVWWVPTSAVR